MSHQYFNSLREEHDLIGRLANMGIWLFNLETEELFWDERMFRIYDIDPDTFGNTLDDWRRNAHPEDREPVIVALKKAINEGQEFISNFRIIKTDGQIHFIKANAKEIAPNKLGQRMVLGVNQDVTDILKNDYELEELIVSLKDAQSTARIGAWQYYPATNTSVLDAVTKSIYGLEPDYEIDAAEGITF